MCRCFERILYMVEIEWQNNSLHICILVVWKVCSFPFPCEYFTNLYSFYLNKFLKLILCSWIVSFNVQAVVHLESFTGSDESKQIPIMDFLYFLTRNSDFPYRLHDNTEAHRQECRGTIGTSHGTGHKVVPFWKTNKTIWNHN